MKICLIGPVYPYRGGIAHYTTLLAKHLVQEGHSVEVISFKNQFPKWLYPGKTDQDNSSNALKVPARYLLSPLDPLSWLRAEKYIREYQPSIVLAMWWSTFWAPCYGILAWLLKNSTFKLSLLIHNVVPHEPRFFDLFFARFALTKIDKHIVQTSEQENKLKNIHAEAEIFRATHPVYSVFNASTISRENARKELGLPDNARVVLFFGLVRPYKGLGILINSFVKISQKEKNIYLIVAGEFWEDEKIYWQKIESYQLQNRTKFINHYISNEEVPKIFRASDIFVAPYIGGSQSGAVNVAVGFNLPIIMTNVISESVPPFIRDRCQVIPPDDSDALVNALKVALDDNHSQPFPEESINKGWQDLIRTIEHLA